MINEREVDQTMTLLYSFFSFGIAFFPPLRSLLREEFSVESERSPPQKKLEGLAACVETAQCCVRARVRKNSEVFFS